MASHSSILAWKIPWTEELSELQSMGHEELDMTEHAHLRAHTHTYINTHTHKYTPDSSTFSTTLRPNLRDSFSPNYYHKHP